MNIVIDISRRISAKTRTGDALSDPILPPAETSYVPSNQERFTYTISILALEVTLYPMDVSVVLKMGRQGDTPPRKPKSDEGW